MWTGAVALLLWAAARAGGEVADIAEFPFLTSLQRRRSGHCCVATIITFRWLLTAAHCVKCGSPTAPSDFVVIVAGVSNMAAARYLKEGQRGCPDRFVVHPLYCDSCAYDYDLAMVRLRYPLLETLLVRRVALPADLVDATQLYGENCTVVGWGTTVKVEARGASPLSLMKVSLALVDPEDCAQGHGCPLREFVHLCSRAPHMDPSKDYTGAALLSSGVLVGIVSWGNGSANYYPGVYARVDTQLSWLQQVVSGAPLRRPAPALYTYCLVAAIIFLT